MRLAKLPKVLRHEGQPEQLEQEEAADEKAVSEDVQETDVTDDRKKSRLPDLLPRQTGTGNRAGCRGCRSSGRRRSRRRVTCNTGALIRKSCTFQL